MLAIRFHGRGGQGAVVASKLLADALFREGWHVQAFPSFGAERTGAPVAAFVRADHQPVTIHSHIYTPDHVVLFDPMLLTTADVLAGLRPGGWVLVNSARRSADLGIDPAFGAAACDATAVALRHRLGSRTHPIVNTSMVGAFAALTRLVTLESVLACISDVVPARVAENRAAAAEAYGLVEAVAPVVASVAIPIATGAG